MDIKNINIKINIKDDGFSWYNCNWNDKNYENDMNNTTLKYFNNVNNEENKKELDSKINEINNKICELIKQKVMLESEKECLAGAESTKEENKEIDNYNRQLKSKNHLNIWYDDLSDSNYKVSQIIENAVYLLRVWYTKKPNKSWRTEKEQYEIGYTFAFNEILGDKIIKNVSKKVSTKEEIQAYIEGRKKAFSQYFQAEKPVIIEEYKYLVEPYRIRLNGLKLESEC